MGKLKNYFKDIKKGDNINQSFLICNTNLNMIYDDLKQIINDYIFDNRNLYETNLMIIEPEKNVISKDKILDLQKKFFQTSQIYNKKVYIINQCEKMNASAYNSLLKFLEEPQKGIYAFLISENVNKVPPTVISRCFILQVSSEINMLQEDNINLNDIINLVAEIETKKLKVIAYESDKIKKYDRNQFLILIKYMKLYYTDAINQMFGQKLEMYSQYTNEINKLLEVNNLTTLSKKIMLLNNLEQKIIYNLNVNLAFDKMIIEMEKINESSNS